MGVVSTLYRFGQYWASVPSEHEASVASVSAHEITLDRTAAASVATVEATRGELGRREWRSQ